MEKKIEAKQNFAGMAQNMQTKAIGGGVVGVGGGDGDGRS